AGRPLRSNRAHRRDQRVAPTPLMKHALAPADAARLPNGRFPSPLVLSGSRTRKLPDTLSRLGIAGGAVYDALVALAAKEHGAALATQDARARGTYDAAGVEGIVVT